MDNNSFNRKIIEVKNLSKDFLGVKALSNFYFDLYKGEVHCLIGENGAGKSTFIKILSGAISPNRGEIYIEGEKYNSLNPSIARKLGIQTVYQDEDLVSSITVAENIFLGSQKDNQRFFMNYRGIFKLAKELMASMNISIRADELYGNLSPADKQFVKIIKALIPSPKVLILDEPTVASNVNDVKLILKFVKKIREDGISVIYISHYLDEVIEVADKITVLRDGKKVKYHDLVNETIGINLLAKEMIGRPVNLFYQKKKRKIGDVVFKVSGLKLDKYSKEINLDLRKGEILGIAGLKGSGRTEIARAIFGADKKYKGELFYKNRELKSNNPKEAVKAGLGMITENKKVDGLFICGTVVQNITSVGLDKIKSPFINLKKEAILAEEYIKRLKIKISSSDQEVGFLSGGNQQKVVIAKWLFKGVEVLIVDEPTKGIDINTKAEVHNILFELASQGKSIIMISSEMPELIALSDRIIVIRNYEISTILSGEEITEENILLGFMGGLGE